jgi:hypothetical protein
MLKSMQLKIGDAVLALEAIVEVLPDGRKLFHADCGSIGRVVDLCPDPQTELPTIRWESSGTVCDCLLGEEIEVVP